MMIKNGSGCIGTCGICKLTLKECREVLYDSEPNRNGSKKEQCTIMNIECTILNHKDNTCIAVKNVGMDSDDIIIKFKAYESGEWKEQYSTIINGEELIKAVQRSIRC